MKLKRTALISLGALIGFTLFYIGLNQWQHEKESSGKINIVTPNTTPQPTQPQIQTTQPQSNQSQVPQTNQANQQNQVNQTPQTPQTQKPASKPQKTIAQIIKESQKPKQTTPPTQKPQTKEQENIFQIGAFKSQTSLQKVIDKARALGFEPIVKEEKGFYIVRVKLQGSKDGIKLLTAFPGAFKVR